MLDPMAQDEEVEQEMLVVEEEQFFPPRMDPEPEMGAEAAVYDTSPPPPHQSPPILAESAQPGAFDVARLFAVIEANLRENTRQMMQGMEGMESRIKNNMEGMEANTRRMESNMEANTQTIREEMQCMGAGLQGGLEELNKGNEELLRATCWPTEERRRVEVTEKVTETVTETLKGEESTRETRRQVTEYTETREVVERLHGVEGEKDAHTHIHTHR